MKFIKKVLILFSTMFFLTLDIFSAEFFQINSTVENIETVYTGEGNRRTNIVSGRGGFTVKSLKNGAGNQVAYLFFIIEVKNNGVTEQIVKRDFIGNGVYEINNISDIKIKVDISNLETINGNFYGNALTIANNSDTATQKFNYTATIDTFGVGMNREVKLMFGADKNSAQSTLDSSTDFLQLQLKDAGNLIGVGLTPLNFGNVNFGKNIAKGNINIKLKNPTFRNTPRKIEEIKINYENRIWLKPESGVGNDIPVNIYLSGVNGRDLTQQEYILARGLDSGSPEEDIKVIGEVDIDPDQKSGNYNGKIKIRVTYK